MSSILVVGLGPHSRATHLPNLASAGPAFGLSKIVTLDLEATRHEVEAFVARSSMPILPYFIADAEQGRTLLDDRLLGLLDHLVVTHDVRGVIVACEPSRHVGYAHWAITRDLPMLIDKPITMRARASTDLSAAVGLREDFRLLSSALSGRTGASGVSVMCQRRFHPAFEFVVDKVKEVAERTGCGVNSIQSYHSDGQWRTPGELLELDYHSFERGYGKLAHSGYHFVDFVSRVIAAGSAGREADAVRVIAQASRPRDLVDQVDGQAYRGLFGRQAARVESDIQRVDAEAGDHGDVDSFVNVAFMREGRVSTLASINLVHSGFSLRRSFESAADLYRGNGRVRHESHIIQQGPFQSIHLQSFRSGATQSTTDVGGLGHLDVTVFRNPGLVTGWEPIDRRTVADFVEPPYGDHQELARTTAEVEFLRHVDGQVLPSELRSPLHDHHRGVVVLSAAYESLALGHQAGEPIASNLSF